MTKSPKAASLKALTKISNASADAGAHRTPTKVEQLLALLKTPDGVSIEELSNSFGWLQHTTRAALTGLRKKGHPVVRDKQGSVTVYRIGE